MEKLIFDSEIGKICRSILVKNSEYQATQEKFSQFDLLPSKISEMLLRHEGVCFSIYGENVIIPVLIKSFGPDGTIELLNQGAIKFHLQTTIITYTVSEIQGVLPLQSGKHNSAVHSTPEESVDFVLNNLTDPPQGKVLKILKRSLIDAYVEPSMDFAENAVTLGHKGYSDGRFKVLGLKPNIELEKLDIAGRSHLCSVATELNNLGIIADLDMETLDDFTIGSICDDSLKNLENAKKLQYGHRVIFDIENVPDLTTLFQRNILKTEDVPDLRCKKDVVRFRKWLRTVSDGSDAKDIGRLYLDAVLQRHGFFKKTKGKLARTIGVTGLSTAIGAIIGGPPGAAAGAVATPIVDKTVDIVVDLLDQFILDGLLKGWQPRNYFDRIIRPAISAEKSGK